MFTQMSVKQGIKQFKKRSVDSIVKEYIQLHDMTTFGRVCLDYLTPKQKQYKWCAINLIKEKWCVKIKVIACADGRLKISYITKEEVASPTVWMELLLPQLMINVFEEREMKIFDVPGAYLNADMPE